MQPNQPRGRPHRNHGLFSDHSLNVTLPARPDWKSLAGEARPAMKEIANLLSTYTPHRRCPVGSGPCPWNYAASFPRTREVGKPEEIVHLRDALRLLQLRPLSRQR